MDGQSKMDQNLRKILTKEKSLIMLAPSFPLNFRYPNIIGMLRAVGFDKVTEVTYGARMTNYYYAEYIRSHSDQKYFIASPCPTVVAFLANKYPDLVQYLMPIASPMTAMSKIYRKHHPEHKIVFLSPCFAKKTIEAPKYPEFLDYVITFQEMKALLDEKGIYEENFNRDYYFDSLVREYTKIYPVSGGLASTSHISRLFKKSEIFINEGIANIEPIFQEMQAGQCKFRFLDILNCSGGCIGGPTVNDALSIAERKLIIESYQKKSSEKTMGTHEGTLEDARGVEFSGKI